MTVKRQFSVFEKNVLCLISSFEVIVSTITKKGKKLRYDCKRKYLTN